jgi:multisubunit Na+/H+ antiporter MnhG subunit
MPALLAPLDEARENLRVIRQTMERSTQYSTLSGLSGVLIGLTAIVGVFATNEILRRAHFSHQTIQTTYPPLGLTWLAVLLLAVGIEFACNKRRAVQIGKRVASPLGAHIIVAAVVSGCRRADGLLYPPRHGSVGLGNLDALLRTSDLCGRLILSAPGDLFRSGVRAGRIGDTAAAGPAASADDGGDLWRLPYRLRRPDGAEARVVIL